MIFLFDTNVFIEAKNRYYRFGVCPGFWNWLKSFNPDETLSITRVREELLKGNDDLKDFIKELPKKLFAEISDSETQNNLGIISSWISNGRYKDSAVRNFLDGADPWLIAFAVNLIRNGISCTIVTEEQPKPDSKRKIFIPDVCKKFNVPYCDTFDMLERYKVQFQWME